MKAAKIIFWALVGLVVLLALFLALEKAGVVRAAGTNINPSPTSSVAWDDPSGYWDFYNTQSVTVAGTKLSGYASSTIGAISLDCATSPNGNICGTSNYGICNGPGPHNPDGTCPNGDAGQSGVGLTGYAWNDEIGWISFNCDQSSQGGTNTCGTSNYSVQINGSNGNFSGYAWNDKDGWISFNCGNNGNCSHPYLVNSSWRATSTYGYLTSSIFDTKQPQGVTLKSLTWEGTSPANTCVDFQVAGSQSTSGPWTFLGPASSTSNYYGAACSAAPVGGIGCAPPDTPICVDSSVMTGYRYYRYQARLRSNLVQSETPVVNDVILNFSQ